ncbi:hypothetical protein BX611_2401 [Lutibacter oceani]|uniref:Secreted protein n=1 Tax=Lutibacter oceani TaxID=1853311 RepID=A0A3D9RME2_9FLAO|nr:hypothetical protein [Lutibacter oceani]REE80748.1 hypothetical protein BX611_2401 [Lutibacter oceani]
MRQFFTKITAVLMAFVVLFSTMSFTISEHFCGDYLVDSALFSKAESCGMEMQKPSPTKDCSINKDNCCSDILKQFEGQSELKTDVFKLNFEQQVFITSFVCSYINLFEGLEENIIPFKDYSPPFIVKDIQTLDEIFLI